MTRSPPVAVRFEALLVADLHLTPHDARGLERIVALLGEVPRLTRQLWLLGDLFDLWLTGDERKLPAFAPLVAAFRAARAAGVAITFLPGNRDFNFTSEDGAALGIDVNAGEETVVVLGGEPTCLLHGDQLLTDDRGYQALKRVVRSALVRWLTRHVPAVVPLAVGRRIRRYSDRAVPQKSLARLQIVEAAVRERLVGGTRRVMCGHVHRFERRRVADGELLVLPPFCDDGEYLAVATSGEGAASTAHFWRGRAGAEPTPLAAAAAAGGAAPGG